MVEPPANTWISASPFWSLVTTLPASLLFGFWYFWGINYFNYGVLEKIMDPEVIAAWLAFSLIAAMSFSYYAAEKRSEVQISNE